MSKVDPRTGRAPGDHGTAAQAIDFALDWRVCDMPFEFLTAWRDGGAFEEWPEFYSWLKQKEAA